MAATGRAIVSDRRILLQRAPGDTRWALSCGAVEFGESASDALVRALLEEMGEFFVVSKELGTLHHASEHAGVAFKEKGLYCLASPRNPAFLERAGPFGGAESDRGLEFDRFNAQEPEHLDCRPSGTRERLAEVLG